MKCLRCGHCCINYEVCGIHEYDWYKLTPCFQHTQIEKHINMECRMGQHILK